MLKRTALFEEHRKLGGKLIDFGGWELPVQYSGVIDEHRACRTAAGLFDVSHMGEVHVEGSDAEAFLNYLVTNQVGKVAVGQAQYTVMCLESGGIVDDLIIYRRGSSQFLLVVNASNTEKDYAHILSASQRFMGGKADLKISNESARYSQIAVQGPRAAEILQKLTTTPLSEVKTYWFVEGKVLDQVPAILARTGYTGEDGFEVYVAWEQAPAVWRALLEVGAPLGLKPCGLGARDTLRLEMKYPLYGNELTENTHPLEAGLGWVVKLDKPDFLGKTALVQAKERGLLRKLVGFKLTGRGIARHGYSIYDSNGQTMIGEVTSGTQSPLTRESIGIGYVPLAYAHLGAQISIQIRDSQVTAEVVSTPFYQKQS